MTHISIFKGCQLSVIFAIYPTSKHIHLVMTFNLQVLLSIVEQLHLRSYCANRAFWAILLLIELLDRALKIIPSLSSVSFRALAKILTNRN